MMRGRPDPSRNASRIRRAAAGAVLAGLAVPAQADPGDPAALYLRSLAATCAACHGTDGRPAEGATLPGLAGRPAAELIRRLEAFGRGARPGTVMPQIARGYSEAQIAALAGYFAAQPAPRP